MTTTLKQRITQRLGHPWLIALLILAAFAFGFFLRGGQTAGPETDGATETSGHDHDHAAEAEPTEWTCSMHPQIRQPKPGLCPICAMDLIPVSNMGDALGLRSVSVSPAAAALMQIKTSPVERRFVEAEIRMVGKITYDETRLKYITAWVGGRIDRLFVDFTGVAVNEGDHMVELYSPELLEAQEVLIQARRAVDQIGRSSIGSVREATTATLDAARERLLLWGLTEEQVSEIEKRGTASDQVTINAPMGGIVVHKNAQEGMYVQTGTQIYTIADLSHLWVEFDAYESDLAWLRYGQTLEFTAEAFPGETFTGTVAFIDPTLDDRRRTVSVRVNVDNRDGRLRPGMFVRGAVKAQLAGSGQVVAPDLAGKWISPMHPEIVKDGPGPCDICGMPLVEAESLGFVDPADDSVERPLVVPATAVLRTGTRAIVYVQMPDTDEPIFEGREVVLGPRAGDHYIVRSNLEAGEIVVTHGNFKIDSALQLSAKPSMMTPDGGGGGGGHQHDHGTPAAQDESKAESAAMSDIGVSETFRGQWNGVETAYRRLEQAIGSDELDAVHERFAAVGRALALIDMHSLEGDAHNLWMESSMRMRNDLVEGKDASTLDTAKTAFERLAGNVNSVRNQFGLDPHAGHAPSVGEIPPELTVAIDALTQDYLSVAEALAADDADQTKDSLTQLAKRLDEFNPDVLPGDAGATLAQSHEKMRAAVEAMRDADSIEGTRTAFAPLSEELARTLRSFGDGITTPVYQARCPMALNNQGANWLQRDATVNNPYFGAMMLRCGSILEMLSEGRPSASEHQGHGHE